MEKFRKPTTYKFEGVTYNIIGEISGETDRGFYEDKVTDYTRVREIFAYRPWWIGKKFRWLKKVTLKEQLIITRHTSFDDGWSYQNIWQPWKKEWNAIEILS
jgi:hypothetical protein